MVTPLEEAFPGLAKGGYRVTSPRDDDYNCIAWAAGETRAWWWPGRDAEREYWPPGVPRERMRGAFVAAFASLGYAACEGEGPEAGYEKIALFADADGRPTHAARQLPSGRWTSKLGVAEDIEHDLHDLEGVIYGAVVLVMKRAARTAADGGA
ncbi:MAG TPA: hypothetical protein VMS17_10200 [Gemmataceae bacterium]|nr:hypothetical protein [Gemmataceae bacterium]